MPARLFSAAQSPAQQLQELQLQGLKGLHALQLQQQLAASTAAASAHAGLRGGGGGGGGGFSLSSLLGTAQSGLGSARQADWPSLAAAAASYAAAFGGAHSATLQQLLGSALASQRCATCYQGVAAGLLKACGGGCGRALHRACAAGGMAVAAPGGPWFCLDCALRLLQHQQP